MAGESFIACLFASIAEDVPGKLTLGTHVKGKNPLVDLKVALESAYRLAPSRQEYALNGLNLRVDGTAAQFSRLALALTGEVRADLAKEIVNADLVAKFDETTIKAKATMTKFDAPHYGFDVDVDKVNLDRYLAASPKAKPAPGAGDKVDVDVPVDLSPLKGLKADGKVAVGALQVQGLKLAEVKAQLEAAGGHAIWGRPITREQAGVAAFSPVSITTFKPDLVDIEVAGLGKNVTTPGMNLGGVKLTPEQHYDYIRLSGQRAKDRLDTLVKGEGWDYRTDEKKASVIRETISESREWARKQLTKEYPELKGKIREEGQKMIPAIPWLNR